MPAAVLHPQQEETESMVARAFEELKRRFGGGGCVARARDLARLLPGVTPSCAEEALHRLCDEGVAELACLADGSLAFYFPRR